MAGTGLLATFQSCAAGGRETGTWEAKIPPGPSVCIDLLVAARPGAIYQVSDDKRCGGETSLHGLPVELGI